MVYLQWLVVHICAWALIVTASAAVGRVALRKLRFDSCLERFVFTVAVGLGLWSLFLFGLGLLGLLYQSLILALTLTAVIATAAQFAYSHRNRKLKDWPQLLTLMEPRSLVAACVIAIALGYWGLLFQRALYPPINWDSTAYHLVLAREYLNEHRIVADYGVTLPVLPALNHMIFTWGMAIEDDIVAQLMEHTLMMLTALALFAWGKRQNKNVLGMAAAAFWLAHPLVLYIGESAYVDAGFACYVFLGIYALRIFCDEHENSWWYVAVMLLAMAGGIRLQGLFFMALASAFGLWATLKKDLSWRAFFSGGFLYLLMASPWYGFIANQTGNPFWPAFANLSPGVWGIAARSIWRTWSVVGVPKTPINFLLLPIEFVTNPAPFLPDNGRPLFRIVIAFPLAWVIAFVNKSVRWWVFWALAYTAFWFLSSQQLRFWVAALPLVALAMYESFQWLVERVSKSTALQTAIWIVLVLIAVRAGTRTNFRTLQSNGWPPPATAEAREQFLSRVHVAYAAARYIKEHRAEGEGVYTINGSWLTYDLDCKVLDASAPVQESFRPAFHWPEDQRWEDWLDSQNIKWILINHNQELASQVVLLPKRDPMTDPFWPDFELVYSDSTTWVFRRKPIPQVTRNENSESKAQPAPRKRATYNSCPLGCCLDQYSTRQS